MIKLHFWQLAVARITALLIGIVIGAYWHEFFTFYTLPLVAVGILGSLYVLYVVVKQYKK
jgi:uncharacterized membrane protein YgaE (UPF0421/DUF939 family)